MIMAFLVLIAGLLLSGTAAYYSIIGLLAIFPGAIVPIALMGSSLEFAKLVAASWLYRNWDIAPKILKGYFVFAIIVLMFITSLGTFGYLSKVHLESSIGVADNSLEISRIEQQIAAELKYPIFVKPANMGSSVGVSKAHDFDELVAATDIAMTYDEWLVFEEAIVGREIEVAVLGSHQPQASVAGEIVPGHEFYDYEDKYLSDGAQLMIPAPLTAAQSDTVRQLAIEVFQALRGEGLARVDFFFEENGRGFLCNEVNTMPGFTPISMYPKLWMATGVSYSDLIDRLVELARERHSRRRRNTGH